LFARAIERKGKLFSISRVRGGLIRIATFKLSVEELILLLKEIVLIEEELFPFDFVYA
jgi:hypothetical protein